MIFSAPDDCAEPRATPLYAATAELSATNSWTSVNGYAAARVFTSIGDEYRAACEDAALVDLGPIRRYTLRGADAAMTLSRLSTTPASDLAVAESARGLILDDGGAVVDFAGVTRLAGDLFLLTTAAPIDRRLHLSARGFDVELRNIGDLVAALGIVGPAARDAAAAAGIDVMSADATAQGRVRGIELAVRPINFGAAPGVEIICPAEDALVVWERLRRKRALPAAGLEAIDILRIEGGTPRLGVDFIGADAVLAAGAGRLPDEIGLPHLAPPNRAWFSGRRAMKSARKPKRRLVVLSADCDQAPPGTAVLAGGTPAGRITSAAFSPRLKRVLCFAEIGAAAIAGPFEIALAPEMGGRAPARLHETAESRLAGQFRENLKSSDGFSLLRR